jgi:hypothetical protein
MTVKPGYTVLPVSVLKNRATVVFDALKDGKTVYVSNRGRVVAAFRPYAFVPAGVAALHASPYLNVSRVTARDMLRSVPSAAITDAAHGLPSIVEKNGRVYGILTRATVPSPPSTPDAQTIGEKAELMRQYQTKNPHAPLDAVMNYYGELDGAHAESATERDWPLVDLPAHGDADAVSDELDRWRDEGSQIEDAVQFVMTRLDEAIPAVVDGADIHVRLSAVPDAIAATLDFGSQPERAAVIGGEQFEATGEAIHARANYLSALIAGDHPNVGVMYRLGNLARLAGNMNEAAHWFKLSFAYDALEQQNA